MSDCKECGQPRFHQDEKGVYTLVEIFGRIDKYYGIPKKTKEKSK